MDKTVEYIIKRQEQLESYRAPWENLWQDCTDFVNPRRGDFSHNRARAGTHRFDKVFDSTAPLSNEHLAAGLHGHLTNPAEHWFVLKVPGFEPSFAMRTWMQETVNLMFDTVFNVPRTNFTTALHELYLDLGSYGTAVMYVEDRPGRVINFRTFHLADCFIAENFEGRVDTLYRKYKHTARQLVQLYSDVLPEKLREVALKDPQKEFTCIHAVEPRDDYNDERNTAKDMPWKSCYVLVEEKLMLEESGFREFPYMVPRWSKTAGETYGRSPAMMCMPDIKMVNEMMKTTIRAAQKATDPPLMVPDDGFMLPLRTIPGGLNYYRSGTGDRVEPLNTGSRPDLGLEFIQSRRDHISKTFHVDWLRMAEEGPQMTATEVLQRQEDKMRLMGPMVGRLQTEFLGPLVDRIFNILIRRNVMPGAPVELEGRELTVDYLSPVIRAQKAQLVFNFGRLMEYMAPLGQIKPEIFDNIDVDATYRWAHETLDAPIETLVEVEQVQAARQERQQQMQQAQEMQQAQQAGATAKDMADAASTMGMGEANGQTGPTGS